MDKCNTCKHESTMSYSSSPCNSCVGGNLYVRRHDVSIENQITEMILVDSLKKIRMHKEIFRKISRDCPNHVDYSTNTSTPRCTRTYNKNKGPIKFCGAVWCPLLKEDI